MKIPLLEYFTTVSAKEFPLLSCVVAPAEEFALLDEYKYYSQLNTHYSQSKTCVSYSWNIKYEDITQIDEDDIKEMDIKWNMALLSIRAERFWKKTGKKITIQGSDVAGFNKSKVECFNCHKMDHFARECRAPRSQDRGKRESYRQGPKEEEQAHKDLMAIDRIGWDWSYMANEEENHSLVADEEVLIEFNLMVKSSSSSGNEVKKEKEGLDDKLTGFESALKDLDTLLET
nr:ribonuclease H-like domain-containing protein [Tanacetum cinerariifolium]